jgi:hypothetical protein
MVGLMAAGNMRRLRDYQSPVATVAGANLARQLRSLEDNAGDAVAEASNAMLQRFTVLNREEGSSSRIVAPGQALGITSIVTRVGLEPPSAKHSGKLTAIYKSSLEYSEPVIKPTNGALINGADSYFFSRPGLLLLANDGVNYFTTEPRELFDVTLYGASPNAAPAVNVAAIQRAIDAAERAGRGVVIFPGGPGTLYPIDAQLTVTSDNIKLWAPGGARLLIASAIQLPIAVGDIEGVDTTEANFLASDAAAGAVAITLDAGKGASFEAGGRYVILSDAVIPEHDAAVTNKRAEFISVFSVSTDTLSLNRPLRYDYATADNAQVYRVPWIRGFEIEGLGADGNDQTTCPVFIQMSWCEEPKVTDVEAVDLQQRFVRFQGCYGAFVEGVRQMHSLSNGFHGDVNHFGYVVAEQGLNEGLIARNIFADRCRHGYTTGATWTNNNATGATISGIGVPTGSDIGPGVHTNSQGAGWDTHEVGIDITFRSLKTIGSLGVGMQTRSVRTRFVGDCFVRDCIGAAIQIGSDAQYTMLESFDYENTNLGTDEAEATDWTVLSPIRDNSLTTIHGAPKTNSLDNGSFDLWQRGSSFSATGATCNRWRLNIGAGETCNVQQRPLTATDPGTGPWFARFTRSVTGSAASTFVQYIDDVRTLAGKRVTLAFWSRDDIDGSDLDITFTQYFGTGGSPSADVVTAAGTRRLDGSWKYHHVTFDLPSMSGKTVGSAEDSHLLITFSLPTANGNQLFDLKDVHLSEARRPRDYVRESADEQLSRCQRWWETSYVDGQAPGSASSKGNVVSQSPTAGNANSWGRTSYFATRKGREPTVTLYAPATGTASKIRNITAGTDIDGTISNTGQGSFHTRPTNSGDVAANNIVTWSWVAAVANFE